MENTTMQVNGSQVSLRFIRSSLPPLSDSIEDFWKAELYGDRPFDEISEFMSIVFQLRTIRELVSEKKEAITKKGKLHMCLKFPTLIRIRMIESDVEYLVERFLFLLNIAKETRQDN